MAASQSTPPSSPTPTPNSISLSAQLAHLADTRRNLHRNLLHAKLRALRRSLHTPGNAPATAAALDLARLTRALADHYPQYAPLCHSSVHINPARTPVPHEPLLPFDPANHSCASVCQSHDAAASQPPLLLHCPQHVSLPNSLPVPSCTSTPPALPHTSTAPTCLPTPHFQTRTYYNIHTNRATERRAVTAPPTPFPRNPTFPFLHTHPSAPSSSPPHQYNNDTSNDCYNTDDDDDDDDDNNNNNYSSYRFNTPYPYPLDSKPPSDATRLAPGATPLFSFQTRTNYPFRLTYTPHSTHPSNVLRLRVPLSHLSQPLLQSLNARRPTHAFFDPSAAPLMRLLIAPDVPASEDHDVVDDVDDVVYTIGADGHLCGAATEPG